MDANAPKESAIEISEEQFDIAKHNVVVTVLSKLSGEHRTFSIETVLKDTNWGKKGRKPYIVKAGTRVAYLLTGPDREKASNWTRFGFVGHTGIISVFSYLKGENGNRSRWEDYARVLACPRKFMKTAEFKLMAYCTRCNRPLTHPESIDSGIGPICREKARMVA
jgi:hypothetical protein